MGEAFGAAKEVKVGGHGLRTFNDFPNPLKSMLRGKPGTNYLTITALRAGGHRLWGHVLVILYLMAQSNSFASVLPIIALYLLVIV